MKLLEKIKNKTMGTILVLTLVMGTAFAMNGCGKNDADNKTDKKTEAAANLTETENNLENKTEDSVDTDSSATAEDTEVESNTSNNEGGQTNTESADEKNQSAASLAGTYTGSYTTNAMGSELVYDCTLTFNEDNTYSYTAKYIVSDKAYEDTEAGSYTLEESSIILTPQESSIVKQEEPVAGTIAQDGSITITRLVSAFAFSPVEVTFNK